MPTQMSDNVTIDSIRAQVQTFCRTVTVTAWALREGDAVCFELRRRVAILENLEEESFIEARYPCNWREAVKERWLPKWALKRWPVRWTTITRTEKWGIKNRVFHPDLEVVNIPFYGLQEERTVSRVGEPPFHVPPR